MSLLDLLISLGNKMRQLIDGTLLRFSWKVVKCFIISILFTGFCFAESLDLGFISSKYFIKIHFNDDMTAYRFSFAGPQILEIELTKNTIDCFLTSQKITDSIKSLPIILTTYSARSIDDFSKDLDTLASSSGYSNFSKLSQFVNIFRDYLKTQIPRECISEDGFKNVIEQIER